MPRPFAVPHLPTAPRTLPPAVILAGGRASRMGGGDKPLLILHGRPLLAHILDRLAGQAAPVALNANGPEGRFAAFGLPVIADSLADQPGPLAGVLAAMDWAAGQGSGHVLTVAGDTPFLPPDLVRRLWIAALQPSPPPSAPPPPGPAPAGGAMAVVPPTNLPGAGLALAASAVLGQPPRLHPVLGLWPVALRDDLARFLATGNRRVRAFTDRHHPGLAVWPCTSPDPFANINTPQDLAQAHLACPRSDSTDAAAFFVRPPDAV